MVQVKGINDARDFKEVEKAMQVLGWAKADMVGYSLWWPRGDLRRESTDQCHKNFE